jgi:heat shock protein HslJ
MDPVTTRPVRRPTVRLLATVVAVVALATALAGCGASATPSASLGPIELNGTNWLLVSYLSPTGTSYTVPSAVTPGATFQDGQFSANTGCNTAGGPYTQDGTSIAIGPVSSTKMACQEPMATVELAYLAAISVVDTAVGNDKTLILRQSDGFTALEFVRGN